MKKNLILCAAAALLCTGAFAQDAAKPQFKWYGFVRNYFAFDSRESTAGTEDLYYYMPKDQNIVEGEDLNAIPSFRFAALTSRLGLDVTGYEFNDWKIAGKIETDFYSGVSGVTGTATLRMRQAFVTLKKDASSWKIGQAWHPMAADMPDILSLEIGVPFGPFSRTPQVNYECALSDKLSLTAAAIWQMQYTSTGPSLTKATDGTYNYKTAAASADYIKYSCTPEFYLGFNFKQNKNIYRIGADVLSIKPRNYNHDLLTGKAISKVDDRLTTVNVFAYAQETAGNWVIKEKVTYAQDGSHMNLVGGYGVSEINSDGSWEYTPTSNVSAWLTAAYKKSSKWVPSIFLGYIQNFGTSEAVVDGLFWKKNSADSIAQMYRIQPDILYNMGKLSIGLEYMMTSVQYGKANEYKVVNTDLHWITNHRVQMMVKYTF